MKSNVRQGRCLAAVALSFLLLPFVVKAQQYKQTNLVSDIPGLAPCTDAHLLNPWGLISTATSPWWVSDNNGGVSTLYNGNLKLDANGNIICASTAQQPGLIQSLVVNIPGPQGGAGTPTGVVATGGLGFLAKGQAVIFAFVTEDGTIVAWAPGLNPKDLPDATAIVADNSQIPSAANGAVYKGATIAQMTAGGPNFLYVTNIRSGKIEIYDTNFSPVMLKSSGDDGDRPFTDEEIPRGFAPFNIQAVNGNLYVTYAKQNSSMHDDLDFPGAGFVDKFSPTGVLLQRLQHGPWLNAPWGVALAGSNFGFYSNHLLIGNAGSGQIAVYDAATGRFDDLLRDANGHALQNSRLWALRFGTGGASGPTNWLFFTAGIAGPSGLSEADGLFGFFVPGDSSAPEDSGNSQ